MSGPRHTSDSVDVMSSLNSSRQKNGSRLAKIMHSVDDCSDTEESRDPASYQAESLARGSFRSRAESSPVRTSFSSSFNQATPARSYFQRTYHIKDGMCSSVKYYTELDLINASSPKCLSHILEYCARRYS